MDVNWKSLFLSPRGRIGRGPFWIGFAIIFAVSFFLPFIPIVGPIAGLLLIWPQIAINAKRLHDMGRSAWWMGLPLVVIILSGVLAALAGGASVLGAMVENNNQALANAAGGVLLTIAALVFPILFWVGFVLWMGLRRGDPETNVFGPPPGLLR